MTLDFGRSSNLSAMPVGSYRFLTLYYTSYPEHHGIKRVISNKQPYKHFFLYLLYSLTYHPRPIKTTHSAWLFTERLYFLPQQPPESLPCFLNQQPYNMEYSDLFQEVKTRMGEFAEMDVSHLTPDSRIATAFPNLDSLQMYEMLVYLEETMGFEVDETVIDKFETVGNLVEYIYEKKQSKVS